MAAALRPGPCAVHLKSVIKDCQPSMMKSSRTGSVRQNVHAVRPATGVCDYTINQPADCVKLIFLAQTEW